MATDVCTDELSSSEPELAVDQIDPCYHLSIAAWPLVGGQIRRAFGR